jgi:hypothetical protein
VDSRALLSRLIVRTEYNVRLSEAARSRELERDEQLGAIAGELGYVRTVLGDEPDLEAKPPRMGSGLALKVHYLWKDFAGRVGKPAISAAVGGGAVAGAITVAKIIWEALK